jgi:hypothetical protein
VIAEALASQIPAAMLVEGFAGEVEIQNVPELLAMLRTERRDEFGAFSLSGANKTSLAVMTRGDLAFVYFFPDDQGNHPGFEPIGMTPPGSPSSVFFLQTDGHSANGFDIPAEHLVSSETAYAAAAEYFEKQVLPSAINWLEL